MNQRDRSYWIEQTKDKVLRNEGRADKYAKQLVFLYDEAGAQVEKEIQALYAKFAADNALTSAEAEKLLIGKEYSVWRSSMERYIADAALAGKRGSKTLLELNTLAMKSRISRKDQLLGNIYRSMIDLAGDAETKLTDLLGDMLKVNYYEQSFRLQRGLGVAWKVAEIDEGLVKQVLDAKWSEKHFSEALWGNIDHLSAVCKREISLGLIQGSSIQRMAKAVNDVMDNGRYNAERLVRTECANFATQGELMGYKENGIKRYRVLGGNEGCNCNCDEAVSNGPYDVDKSEPGINAPPFHPNCKCTIVADFDLHMFANRDVTPLAENVKYQEWKQKYLHSVAKNTESGIMKEIELRNIPITDKAIAKVPVVQCGSLSRRQAKQLQKRHQELLRFVQNEPPGKEAICYCDMKMNVITQYKGKGNNAVSSSPISIPHIAMHNHPSSTTFTMNDIRLLAGNDFTKILTAVGNDGSVFLLEKGKAFEFNMFESFSKKIQSEHPNYLESPEKYLKFMKTFLKEVSSCGLFYREITV